MTDEPGWGLRYLEEHWQEWMEFFMHEINTEVNINYVTENSVQGDRYEDCRLFLLNAGLEPTPDAIMQLRDAFLPALEIICTRGYDPDGKTWKLRGWRGMVHDILDKAERLKFHSWQHSRFHKDSAIDIINFAGFYVRLENQGDPWGTWGNPDGGDAK